MDYCVKVTLNLPPDYPDKSTDTIADKFHALIVATGLPYIDAFERGQNGKYHYHIVYGVTTKPRQDNSKRQFEKILKANNLKSTRPTLDVAIKPTLKYEYDGFKFQVGYCTKEPVKENRTNLSKEQVKEYTEFYHKNNVKVEESLQSKFHQTTINELCYNILDAFLQKRLIYKTYDDAAQFETHLNEKLITNRIFNDYVTEYSVLVTPMTHKQILTIPLYSWISNNLTILENQKTIEKK